MITASVLGCTSPLSPEESRALPDAEARWAARAFPSYSFEVRQSCFCAPVLYEWSRVEVINGVVARVVTLSSGAEVSAVDRSYFPTVERLFESIRRAAREDWVKGIDVEFDRQLGYPRWVRFVSKPDVLDAGGSYELRNAAALP